MAPAAVVVEICKQVLRHSLALLTKFDRAASGEPGAHEPSGGSSKGAEDGSRPGSRSSSSLIITKPGRLSSWEASAWQELLEPRKLGAAWRAATAASSALGVPGTGGAGLSAEAEAARPESLTPDAPASGVTGAGSAGHQGSMQAPRVLVASIEQGPSMWLDPLLDGQPQGTLMAVTLPPGSCYSVGGSGNGPSEQHTAPSGTAAGGLTSGMPDAAAVGSEQEAVVVSFPSPTNACALAAGRPCLQRWLVQVLLDSRPGVPLPCGYSLPFPPGPSYGENHGLNTGSLADGQAGAHGAGSEEAAVTASSPGRHGSMPVAAAVASLLHGLTQLAASYQVRAGVGVTSRALSRGLSGGKGMAPRLRSSSSSLALSPLPLLAWPQVLFSVLPATPTGALPLDDRARGPLQDALLGCSSGSRSLLPLHCQAASQLASLCVASQALMDEGI